MDDPYQILGLPRGAAIGEVKKAYRRLARTLHPDLHPGDTKGEDRFKTVTAAYDFLSDETRKARYDRGEIDANGQPKFRSGPRPHPGAGERTAPPAFDPDDLLRDADQRGFFSELFRGMRRDARKARGEESRASIEIDFVDAVNGAVRTVSLPDGRSVRVTIPPGTEDGAVLRLKGQGQPSPLGGPAGDLHLVIRLRPDPRFERIGDDIFADLPITLPEALNGAKITVQTVDGPVALTIPPGANSGTRLRIRGKGAPAAGGGPRGDHYVTVLIRLPEPPDPELRRLIDNWAKRHPYTARPV